MANKLPDPWTHKSGYRLNADGKSIKYEHPEKGITIRVEAMLDEDEGGLQYAVWVMNDEREVIKHPPIRSTKDGAWEKAREFAEEYTD